MVINEAHACSVVQRWGYRRPSYTWPVLDLWGGEGCGPLNLVNASHIKERKKNKSIISLKCTKYRYFQRNVIKNRVLTLCRRIHDLCTVAWLFIFILKGTLSKYLGFGFIGFGLSHSLGEFKKGSCGLVNITPRKYPYFRPLPWGPIARGLAVMSLMPELWYEIDCCQMYLALPQMYVEMWRGTLTDIQSIRSKQEPVTQWTRLPNTWQRPQQQEKARYGSPSGRRKRRTSTQWRDTFLTAK